MVGEVEGMSLWWGRWRGCRYGEGGGGDVAMVREVEGMSLWWGRWRGCRYGGGGGGMSLWWGRKSAG